MATPFIAQISINAFDFAPRGYAQCNGQLLPINQNQALFAILGTTYGGNGITTFALPELRGRAAMHWNGVYPLGLKIGEESHVLTANEMPGHNHPGTATTAQVCSSAQGTSNLAANRFPAVATRPLYADTPDTSLGANPSGATGGGQGHENRQPFLVMNFVIALQGIFPSRN